MKRLLLLISAVCLVNLSAHSQQLYPELTAKQAAKAEKLIVRIERLDALTSSRTSHHEYQSLFKQLLSSLRRDISGLSESSVKTDILTALLFYERGANVLERQSHATTVRCEAERPGAYQRLCETTVGGLSHLLWSKARLHIGWAKAVMSRHKADAGALDASALSEMEAERKFDRQLAESAVKVLARLKNDVPIYNTPGELIEGRTLACVSFETFTADLEGVRRAVGPKLSWLPENRLKNELRYALLSYLDGHFWWKQVYRPAVIHADNNYTEEAVNAMRMYDPEAIKYNVAINWRQAQRHLQRAAELLKGMN
ncbi:MAG TPA: hypothetical protein VGB17_14920 [Pyrinomonadaceae bacterium]|jgi:hypothetical protein